MFSDDTAIYRWCELHALSQMPRRMEAVLKAALPGIPQEKIDETLVALTETVRSELNSGLWVRESRVIEKANALMDYADTTTEAQEDAMYVIVNKLKEIIFLASAPAL